jgi:hypothetical protein
VVDNCSRDGSGQVIQRENPSVCFVSLDRNYGFGYADSRNLKYIQSAELPAPLCSYQSNGMIPLVDSMSIILCILKKKIFVKHIRTWLKKSLRYFAALWNNNFFAIS